MSNLELFTKSLVRDALKGDKAKDRLVGLLIKCGYLADETQRKEALDDHDQRLLDAFRAELGDVNDPLPERSAEDAADVGALDDGRSGAGAAASSDIGLGPDEEGAMTQKPDRLSLSTVPQPHNPRAFLDELQRRDFTFFLAGAFRRVSGGAELARNWHQDAIAHQLERVRRGESRRLIVTMPPRNLKSIAITVAWVAWRLGLDPSLNFVCVSYSAELAEKHARDCRAIMTSEWYRRLFPRTVLRRSRTATHDFETTAGGGRLSTSVTGTLTGRGGDIIIIDDPIKPDEAASETTRKFVNNWFRSTVLSRTDDKARGAIILVMQRLHEYDLAGMLEESGQWDRLSLPAIATQDERIPLTRGRVHHRREGDVLHPERESRETLLALKADMGSALFDAQYQQTPAPAEGALIKRPWLVYHDLPLTPVVGAERGLIMQSWDTASKDGVFNDWSVCITALVRDRDVYLLDVWRRRVEFPELKKAAVESIGRWRPWVTLIEDQASGMQLLQELRNKAHLPTDLIPRRPEKDKVSRVSGISAMIEAGHLRLPREALWKDDFEAELLSFPSGRYDDQVDALSQLMSWVRSSCCIETPPVGGYSIVGDAEDFDTEGSDFDFDQPSDNDDCLY